MAFLPDAAIRPLSHGGSDVRNTKEGSTLAPPYFRQLGITRDGGPNRAARGVTDGAVDLPRAEGPAPLFV